MPGLNDLVSWLTPFAFGAFVLLLETVWAAEFIAKASKLSFASGFWKMLQTYGTVPALFVPFGAVGMRFKAARCIVEIDIILPETPAPELINAPRAGTHFNKYYRDSAHAIADGEQALLAEFRYCCEDAEISFNEYMNWRSLYRQWAERDKQRKFEIDKTIKSNLKSQSSGQFAWIFSQFGYNEDTRKAEPIRVKDFPALDDSRKAINRYFVTLEDKKLRNFTILRYFSSLRSNTEPDLTFLTPVRFENGYLAPLFLITGLLNRFSEDEGWKLIMDNYRSLVEDDRGVYSLELLELRSFLFNCWLLWGPSITHCQCPMWGKQKDTPGQQTHQMLLQYGYGDENNAVDVLFRPDEGENFPKDISTLLSDGGTKLAIPYSVSGVFKWGPKLKAPIGPAQSLVRGTVSENEGRVQRNGKVPVGREQQSDYYNDLDNREKQRDESEGRIILDSSDQRRYKLAETKTSKYYSAYVWIMFVILNDEGHPFFAARWKNLLVYFEHSNIADATTLKTLKQGLIAKISASLMEVFLREGDRDTLRFQYVSALDDPFCADGSDAPFYDSKEFKGVSGELGLAQSLSDYITSRPELAVLQEAMRNDRLLLPVNPKSAFRPRTPLTPIPGYSSCHLPPIIEEFYADLKLNTATGERPLRSDDTPPPSLGRPPTAANQASPHPNG